MLVISVNMYIYIYLICKRNEGLWGLGGGLSSLSAPRLTFYGEKLKKNAHFAVNLKMDLLKIPLWRHFPSQLSQLNISLSGNV